MWSIDKRLNVFNHLTLLATVAQPIQMSGATGGVDSTPPVQFFKIPAKLIYNCRSHAKGHSQKFKIERIEEL